jgi:hypothetical protein
VVVVFIIMERSTELEASRDGNTVHSTDDRDLQTQGIVLVRMAVVVVAALDLRLLRVIRAHLDLLDGTADVVLRVRGAHLTLEDLQ